MVAVTTVVDLRADVHGMLSKAIVGQERTIDGLLLAVLAGGHVLLEGVPGTAKTLMARSLAVALDARFTRVQFTPDLLPSDIIGTHMYRADTGQFEFRPGPIFTDSLLADEINRAPAKTQAALLEAMEERQVTSDGVSRPLGERFMVVATQNPIEYEGTYPLPEAQLDRFLVKLDVTIPEIVQECDLLRRVEKGFDSRDIAAAGVGPALDVAMLRAAREEISAVRVADEVIGYMVAICAATRTSPDLTLGASPRGAIGLLLGARVMAAFNGRDYVTPDDVRNITIPVLRHRLLLRPEAELQGVTEVDAVERALARVAVPR
ncbi:MAG: AAA family ATPase [Candidatus Dormibacteria bacterium]